MQTRGYPPSQGSRGVVAVSCALMLGWFGCGGAVVEPLDEDPEDDPKVAEAGPLPQVPTYPDVSIGTTTIDVGLQALNAYRALAGLSPVVTDTTWSNACLGHLRYLDTLSTEEYNGACVLIHDEPDSTNPHYAPMHEQAAQGALLACERSETGQLSLGRAVDRWINSLYHRLPLLDPGLVRVGAATYGGFVCLHYESGTLPLDAPQRVVWPPSGTADVPRGFAGRERPCPTVPGNPHGTAAEQCPSAGFIITSTWYGASEGFVAAETQTPPELQLANDGQNVPLLAWYADGVSGHDPASGLIPHTVAWVPASPLASGTSLRAQLTGFSWTFRTGSRLE